MLPTKTNLLFIFTLQFEAYVFTTVLSPADRVLNGQDLELTCTHSTAIASTRDVNVNWIENGNTRGNVDKLCDDSYGRVNTTQYGFSCPSIRNYTWTIKSVQESRNDSVWTCSIQIDGLPFVESDPTTIYVISPITSVSIDGNTNVSANAGSQTTVSCNTSTGRPVSTIRWYFDARTPSDTSDDEEITPTSEPVFDFGSETTSGSVTITAESKMTGWGIYAKANNTESMTPIQSSMVTLTVTGSTGSTGSTSDDCEICIWCKIFPWWCIIIIVTIIIIIVVGVCTLGYWKYKGEIYLFGKPRKWPCGSGNNSGNETPRETKPPRRTIHDENQGNGQSIRANGPNALPPITGYSKVRPDDNQLSGDPDKNTPNNEANYTPRPLPILPNIR